MDREWLAERIAEGMSIESIARESGKGASTVAYWINQHGLVAAGAGRHAPKGPIEEATLRELVERGLSVREIAARVDRSPTAVRHWLRRYGMRTRLSRRGPAGPDRPPVIEQDCWFHGRIAFRLTGTGRYRCPACEVERVTDRRRRVKALLVKEAGGSCCICGYDRCRAALQFHHVDPSRKAFAVSVNGSTRSLEALRAEAAKCVLLCANCHAEVEAGVAELPFSLAAADDPRRR